MSQQTEEVKPTLIGHLDPELYEVIERIDDFSLPGDFFMWLSNETFTNKILHEKVENGKFTRIVQYYIDNALVYTGRGELDVSLFPKDTIKFLTSGKKVISPNVPELSKFKRERVSKTASDLFYTVICNFYIQNEFSGVSWEVYELPQISQFYNQKQDPLRYWRKGS